jgi:hypothetical protein
MLKKHEEILMLCAQIVKVSVPASTLHKMAMDSGVSDDDLSLPKVCSTLSGLVEAGLMRCQIVSQMKMVNGKPFKGYGLTNRGEVELNRSLTLTAKLVVQAGRKSEKRAA